MMAKKYMWVRKASHSHQQETLNSMSGLCFLCQVYWIQSGVYISPPEASTMGFFESLPIKIIIGH